MNLDNLEGREPEKDIVDLRLRASCSYSLLSPPLPAEGQVQARFKGFMCCHTHRGSAVCSFFECIGVVCFYGEGDPVRIPSERHLHFVDVERKEAGRLLASFERPPSSVRIETVLLELVSSSSVERLLAATEETRLDFIWNHTACVAYLFLAEKDTNLDIGSEAILWPLNPVWNG